MSLTVLTAIAAAVAVVDLVVGVGLCVVVWHHARALHKGYSFNQWENALFEQWQAQDGEDRLLGIERRHNTLATTVDGLSRAQATDLSADRARGE